MSAGETPHPRFADPLPAAAERGNSRVDVSSRSQQRFIALFPSLRMKRAAGRPKDLIAVEILSALKEERDRRNAGS
ncbi:MAG: hypothetical protein ABIP63_00050 [Thermoanaerobaculia bacterium]